MILLFGPAQLGTRVGTKRPLTQKQIWAVRFFLNRDVTDLSGAIVYGTVTLAAGAMEGRGYIGKEIGFQIPSSALKLKFTGTPEGVKGVVGIDYL